MAQKMNLFRLAFIFLVALCCSACTAGSPEPGLTATAPATQSPTFLPSASAIPASPVPSSTPTMVTITPSKTATALAAQTSTATVTSTPPVKTANAVRENTPVPQPAAPISLDNANRLSELAVWGNGSANDLAYSPDGNTLAVASSLGIYLYDDNSYRVVVIETKIGNSSLAFAPDGEMLAVGSIDGNIDLWRWKNKEHIKTFTSGYQHPILNLAFSPQGDKISYSQTRDTYIINISDGQKLFSTNISSDDAFVFSKDWQFIYTPLNNTIRRTSIATKKIDDFQQENSEIGTIPMFITAVAISRDGKLVVGGNTKAIFWETQTGKQLSRSILIDPNSMNFLYHSPTCRVFMDGGFPIYASVMDISPDNQSLAVGGRDNSIQIRRVSDGQLLGHTSGRDPTARGDTNTGVHKILFHPSKSKLIVLYNSGLIEERDSSSAELLQKIAGHPQAYTTMAVFPAAISNQDLLAIGATSSIISLWELPSGRRVNEFNAQANALAFSPDGGTLAIGTKDWEIQLANLSGGKQVGPITGHQDQVVSLAFFPDEKSLLSTGFDCTLRFWDLSGNTPKESVTPASINLDTSQVIASPDGKWGALLANNQVSLVKKADSQKYILKPLTGLEAVEGIVFSSDGKILASVGDGLVNLYDVEKDEIVHSFKAGGDLIAFSFDGKILAVGNKAGFILLMDTSNGKELYRFDAHRGSATGLAFSNNGRILISTSADGTVRLWGVMD
jgi:WD40 repeat protein